MKKFFLGFILIIFVSSSIIIFQIFYDSQKGKFLEVVFLDVGQGDSIFIQAPNGYQVVVDAGPNSDVVRAISKYIPYYDRSLDLLIATHSDADHVAGFVDLLKRYSVKFYGKNFIADNDSLNTEIINLINEKKIDQIFLRSGDRIVLDSEAEVFLDILWPPKDYQTEDNNDNSVVVLLNYGQVSVLLTGDASVEVEEKLTQNLSENIEADILKVGHHGSDTATSEEFLQVTKPEYAIISAGEGNKFGHPHEEIIQQLEEQKIKILETSVLGSIHFRSDGEEIWLFD